MDLARVEAAEALGEILGTFAGYSISRRSLYGGSFGKLGAVYGIDQACRLPNPVDHALDVHERLAGGGVRAWVDPYRAQAPQLCMAGYGGRRQAYLIYSDCGVIGMKADMTAFHHCPTSTIGGDSGAPGYVQTRSGLAVAFIQHAGTLLFGDPAMVSSRIGQHEYRSGGINYAPFIHLLPIPGDRAPDKE